MTGQPVERTLDMNGGSTTLHLARAPCVPCCPPLALHAKNAEKVSKMFPRASASDGVKVFGPGRPPGYPPGRPRDIPPKNLMFRLLFRSRPWALARRNLSNHIWKMENFLVENIYELSGCRKDQSDHVLV